MPMPVSRTANNTQSPSRSVSRRALSEMVPFSVNFAALLSRLNRHCRSFTASECIVPRSGARSSDKVFPLRWIRASTVLLAS
jgi:hypothetical protein